MALGRGLENGRGAGGLGGGIILWKGRGKYLGIKNNVSTYRDYRKV